MPRITDRSAQDAASRWATDRIPRAQRRFTTLPDTPSSCLNTALRSRSVWARSGTTLLIEGEGNKPENTNACVLNVSTDHPAQPGRSCQASTPAR